MFAAINGKKRGSSFENPEPSSPKVTCIGQVRVKTKKQGKKIRAARSRREVSFRRTEQWSNNNHYQDFGHTSHHHQFQQPQECLPYRNQRWVHLPVTICDALRSFGAEFSCFLPCRSSCKEGKVTHQPNCNGNANGSDSSCGAVFGRWLVVEEQRNENDNENENDEDDMPRRSQRRHVFEDIVIEGDDNKCEMKNEILEEEEEEEEVEGRVSVCIPPKNALLLMRCRSDPVQMAALANRFWECPPPPDEDEAEDEEETKQVKVEQEQQVSCEKLFFSNQPDAKPVEEAEIEAESKEALADPDNEQNAAKLLHENENVLEDIEEKRRSLSCQQEQKAEAEVVAEDEEETEKVHERSHPEMTQERETVREPKEGENQRENLLPDCLLLMMCEPKLSMEVSKETWVCSTDFVRWKPSEKNPRPQKVNKTDDSDEQPKKRVGIPATQQLLMQPPRSSCSFPAAPPLPPALGAPSVKSMGAKPFALTRCKSEPRKSSAKLAPETCFLEE